MKITPKTAANLILLIDQLKQSDLLRKDFQEIIGLSPAGQRKYARMLLEAGVTVIADYIDPTPNYVGDALYRLTDNNEHVLFYLAMVRDPASKFKRTGGRKSNFNKALTDPTRHIHLAVDDVAYPVRVAPCRIPAPDPLLAAFYGRIAA